MNIFVFMLQLIKYLKSNKVTKSRVEGEVRDEQGRKLPHRNAFVLLRKYTKEFFTLGTHPRMIALSGLRGVGKTTLAWQTAYYVYNNITTEIYFISIDELNALNATIYDVINALEEVLGCHLYELDRKIMLIIDEVHDAPNWQRDMKILYERGKKIFVIATGSSALLLHNSSDLASRWSVIRIFPFSFTEFILAKSWIKNGHKLLFPTKGLANSLKQTLFYSENFMELKELLQSKQSNISDYFSNIERILNSKIQDLIDEYISYHNIARFLTITNKVLIMRRILELFDRILIKDIEEANQNLRLIFMRILFRLALSDEINFQTLSKEFRIKETEIEQVITTLNNAEILNVLFPYGGIRSKTGISRKIFFMSPSLRRALFSRIYGYSNKLNNTLRAKLYEDITAMYLRKYLSGEVSFGYGKKKNPDFIIETIDKPMLIEVSTGNKKSTQIVNFPDYRYGIIISSKFNNITFDDDKKILFLPIKWFLLI